MVWRARHSFLHVKSVIRNSFNAFADYRYYRIADLLATRPLGSDTNIKGWIKAVRKTKDNLFVDINDGSCTDKLQVVLLKSRKPHHLSFGASVEANGKLMENDNGQLELEADKVEVVGPCIVTEGYPFAGKTNHPPEYIRKFLHLRSRTGIFNSLVRVRDAATRAIHDYFGNEQYIYIHTPILTSNDCEGAGEVFTARPDNETHLKDMLKPGESLDTAYFNTKVFLTVSGQLHLEALSRGLGNVYSFGPTFRAENSRSRRHLSEFYMLEAEVAFLNDLGNLLEVMEKFLKDITCRVLNRCENDVKMFQNSGTELYIDNIIEKPFAILSFSEACSLLDKHFQGPKPGEKEGLNNEQELFLVNYMGKIPVFVVEWPEALKPFYMKQMPNSKVAAVDLLVPHVGELCGGSIREDDFNFLQQKLINAGQLEALTWYLELRKFGNIPTGGFGMGFERFLQLLLGVGSIKDTIPFPRWAHHCKL